MRYMFYRSGNTWKHYGYFYSQGDGYFSTIAVYLGNSAINTLCGSGNWQNTSNSNVSTIIFYNTDCPYGNAFEAYPTHIILPNISQTIIDNQLATPKEGSMFYDGTSDQLKIYIGNTWRVVQLEP